MKKISEDLRSRILELRANTDLNLTFIASAVGTSRGSVQRTCKAAGLNNKGLRNKYLKGKPNAERIGKIAHTRLCGAEAVYRMHFRSYKQGAKKRGIEFFLEYDFFRSLIQQQCHYCGAGPRPVNRRCGTAPLQGVDRVDSDKEYSIDNCVSCCSQCNRAKSNQKYSVFLEWINRITKYQKKGGEDEHTETLLPIDQVSVPQWMV